MTYRNPYNKGIIQPMKPNNKTSVDCQKQQKHPYFPKIGLLSLKVHRKNLKNNPYLLY